jgi:hypothetical protein
LKISPAISAPDYQSLPAGTLVRVPGFGAKSVFGLVGVQPDQSGAEGGRRFLVLLGKLNEDTKGEKALNCTCVDLVEGWGRNLVSFGQSFEFRFEAGSSESVIFDSSLSAKPGMILIENRGIFLATYARIDRGSGGFLYYEIGSGLMGRSTASPTTAVIPRWQLYLTGSGRECDQIRVLDFDALK